MRLAPSILSFDLVRLFERLPEFDRPSVEVIHLDVMDGQFVPPITFGPAYAKALSQATSKPLEAHLMTLTPEAQFLPFVEAGCRRIIFHAEATVHSHRLVQQLHELGVEAGVALNPGTPVSVIEPLLDVLDLVLVMTVNPGWGGQKLISESLEKVKAIKAIRPGLTVEIDGGVDPSTVPAARQAGVDLMVVGSYLASATDPDAAYSALEKAWR